MLPRNAFNILDWSLRKGQGGKRGVLVLRPTIKHAIFRLVFGIGFFGLMTLGALGVDYEIRMMREKRRLTEADIARLSQIQDQTAPLIAAGKVEQAREIERKAEAFVAELVRQRNAEIAKLEASHRPWHVLLRGLAGVFIVVGIGIPLSPLWQRVRISREGEQLVIHKNFWPRTRSIDISSVGTSDVAIVTFSNYHSGPVETLSYVWQMVLSAQGRSIQLYLATASDGSATPPRRVIEFVDAVRQLGE